MNYLRTIIIFVYIILLAACVNKESVTHGPTAWNAPVPWNAKPSDKERFEMYLEGCESDEVRCLYFYKHDPTVGEELFINLHSGSVRSGSDAEFEFHGAGPSRINQIQRARLHRLISELPPSDQHAPFFDSYHIAVHEGNKLRIYQYSLHDPPAVVKKIYEVADSGTFVETHRRD